MLWFISKTERCGSSLIVPSFLRQNSRTNISLQMTNSKSKCANLIPNLQRGLVLTWLRPQIPTFRVVNTVEGMRW